MLKRRNEVPDHSLTARAQQALSSRGLRPPCNISVTTSNGVITLTGQVEHAHQQQTALAAIRGVSGARGFNSQLQVVGIVRDWDKTQDQEHQP